MELRECTIDFYYPAGDDICISYWEVQLVNYKRPYSYAKWLFTLIVNNHPYCSYEAKDDNELLMLFAKQSIGATKIIIKYNDEQQN